MAEAKTWGGPKVQMEAFIYLFLIYHLGKFQINMG